MAERIRVLHVDDDPEFVDLAETYLERENEQFEVETATSPAAGFDRLTDEFDCVVSDYDMPDRNGIEFLKMVREEYPELPFILFTGKGGEDVASDAISAGVTDYLKKRPGTEQYELLASRIETAVGHYRAERKLQRERERLAAVFDAVPHAITEVTFEDGEPIVRQVNDAFEDVFGYTREQVIGKSLDTFIVSEEYREEAASLNRSANHQRAVEQEVERVTADGERRTFLFRSSRVDDDDPSRWLGTYIDITDRTEREREVRWYKTIVEALSDAVYIVDEDRTIRYVNERYAEMKGLDPEEIVGTRTDRWASEDVLDRIVELSEELKRGQREVASIEYESQTADGESVPVENRFTDIELPDGQWGRVGVIRDITDRKEWERRVEEQRTQRQQREQKLIRLRDYTQELMYAETPSETARIALRAIDEILGFDLGAVFRRSETQADVLETVEMLNQSRMETMYGGLPVFLRDAPEGTHSALAWNVFETGEPVFINDTAESERLARKSPFGSLMIYPVGDHGVVLLAATTLEAFSETEQLLLDLLANALETALDRLDRERELRRQRDELKRQNERLEEFSSVVSHDLRNPLNTLSLSLEMIEAEDDDHLKRCHRAADRMNRLVDDLLELARQGESATDLEPVSLREVATLCWQTVDSSDLELTVESDLQFEADKGRLEQLLENLYRNVTDHAEGAEKITIGTVDDGFYVADDGTGIPESERDSVFESGYSTSEEGTGFGLSIVEGIVDAHGWTIHVTESERGGARFEITDITRV